PLHERVRAAEVGCSRGFSGGGHPASTAALPWSPERRPQVRDAHLREDRYAETVATTVTATGACCDVRRWSSPRATPRVTACATSIQRPDSKGPDRDGREP